MNILFYTDISVYMYYILRKLIYTKIYKNIQTPTHVREIKINQSNKCTFCFKILPDF